MSEQERLAMLAEMESVLNLASRLPGDIGMADIREEFGVSDTTARRYLAKMEAVAGWRRVNVIDKGRATSVWRKAAQAQTG